MCDLKNQIQILEKEQNYTQAISILKKELHKNPRDLSIQTELGNFYALAGNFEEALGYFRRVHHIFRDNPQIIQSITFCLNDLGNEYHAKRDFKQSLLYFEELIHFDQSNWQYLYNYANVLQDVLRLEDAIQYYLLAIKAGGMNDEDLFNNLGNTYQKINNLDEAKRCFEKSYDLKSNDNALIQLIHLNQKLNDWNGFDNLMDKVYERLNHQPINFSFPPFPMLSLPGITNEQYLKIANQWNIKIRLSQKRIEKHSVSKGKIKVAYMSADFRQHPLYHLVYDCLTHHDKDKFEISLLYNGIEEKTEEYKKFSKLPYNFINTYQLSDECLINLITTNHIDILIDLSGFTKNSRSTILAYHPAPIQINWLGYPSTLGCHNEKPLCDFVLADRHIIPKNNERYFSEDAIFLEPTYQPNNRQRPLIQTDKKKFNLPENQFIWGCFNQNLKITKNTFDTWIEILKKCQNSVLWLLVNNQVAVNNIRIYLHENHIQSERVIFAEYTSISEHMGRLSHVDLFLDCYPYNAHTTVADAIYQNKPTLTMEGESMQSRVAGSLLKAVGCHEELVANNQKEYIDKAINFYNNPHELKVIENIINQNKHKLFNPQSYCEQLESIFLRLMSS
jgi:predicted O-linked N-acetylglucosamine transferase (SPINDLY family)